MKLGMQVGLGPGHIVLDGDPAPPKGHTPNFRPISTETANGGTFAKNNLITDNSLVFYLNVRLAPNCLTV